MDEFAICEQVDANGLTALRVLEPGLHRVEHDLQGRKKVPCATFAANRYSLAVLMEAFRSPAWLWGRGSVAKQSKELARAAGVEASMPRIADHWLLCSQSS